MKGDKKGAIIFFAIVITTMLVGVIAVKFNDSDNDKIADSLDKCPNTPEKTVVNQDGCSINQFCSQYICGNGCNQAKWKVNDRSNVSDCTTVIKERGGEPYPACVPTSKNLCSKNTTIPIPEENVTASLIPGLQSYWNVTLSNVPEGFGEIRNGTYLGWCAEEYIVLGNQIKNSVKLYSSYDPDLDVKCPHCADPDWDKVNYLINHKQGNSTDIQSAIWYFINGGHWPSSSDAQAMVNDALANGLDFQPTTGQNIAIIVDLGSRRQLVFIEVDP